MKMIPTQKTIESIRILLIALAIIFIPNKGLAMSGAYIDMTLDSFITYLCELKKIQKKDLETIGFTLPEKKDGLFGRYSYSGYSVSLKDGTEIEEIRISQPDNDKYSFVVINGISPKLELDFFEKLFGKFALFGTPKGKSELEEFTYQKKISNGILCVGLEQHTYVVTGLSIEHKQE